MHYSSLFRIAVAAVAGLLFGAGMVISEMVDPNKVTAFLNVTGAWDPSLAFVMGGALLVFTPIYHGVIKKRQTAVSGEPLQLSHKKKVDAPLILGASLFGIGWGLAGFCPGPVVSSLSSMNPVILVFIVFMLLGMMLANQYLAGRVCSLFTAKRGH